MNPGRRKIYPSEGGGVETLDTAMDSHRYSFQLNNIYIVVIQVFVEISSVSYTSTSRGMNKTNLLNKKPVELKLQAQLWRSDV